MIARRSTATSVDALKEHNPRSPRLQPLKADIEQLEAQLASAETRASEEAAKTAQAIRAFESLARRLEAFAEAQNAKTLRHWWRQIVRRG
jgi:hypothetical protein